jgi:2-succinyl-5-enolpyruvyl-6-hydroxy-3-cyclohexene-1-carboxylate synthase
MTRTPLMVFAADRPPELRDCGANQAIPQANLLAGAARWSADLPCPTTEIPAEFVLSTVDEAFARACGHAGAQAGAVHLNWQFREPLAPDARPWDIGWLSGIARWTNDHAPWRLAMPPLASPVEIDEAVVIVGRTAPLTRHSLEGWRGTMLADITSDLADSGTAGADLVLRAAMEGEGNRALREALQAKALAIVGDAVVSKRLNAWISAQPSGVTVFGAGDPRVDAAHRADAVYAGPVEFTAAKKLKPHAGWKRALACATRAAAKAIASERGLCEPTAVADATSACSDARSHGTLFYGSSMPIRDADFLAIHPPSGWHAGANRGASGIDGLTASATGHALGTREPVVAIIGDVSALHDLSSLSLAAMVETPLVIVVLNNDGGGIFRYLPIAKHGDVFERLFATPHGRSFAAFAKAFGLPSESPRSRAALGAAVRRAMRRGGATLIEVTCTREASEAARTRVAAASDAALRRAFA